MPSARIIVVSMSWLLLTVTAGCEPNPAPVRAGSQDDAGIEHEDDAGRETPTAEYPRHPLCGDGIVEGREVCDPGKHACCTNICGGPQHSAFVCREAAGPCDVPERCDGERFECPADTLALAGKACRDAVGICDAAELCDGAHASTPEVLGFTAGFRAASMKLKSFVTSADSLQRSLTELVSPCSR